MKRTPMIITGIIVLAVVALLLFMMPKQQQSNQAAPSSAKAAATITYTDNGFEPASTTIKSGQSVTFTNSSSGEIQVDSNPHPIHTDDTDLNVGSIAVGASKTVKLTKTGSFGFHNHLQPNNQAHITIQ